MFIKFLLKTSFTYHLGTESVHNHYIISIKINKINQVWKFLVPHMRPFDFSKSVFAKIDITYSAWVLFYH